MTECRRQQVTFLLVALAVVACRPVSNDSKDEVPNTSRKDVLLPFPAAPGSFVDLVETLSHSVVQVRSKQAIATPRGAEAVGAPGADDALGTGFAIEVAARTLVVTTDNVIAPAANIEIQLTTGQRLDAKVIGRDDKLNVALLEVSAAPSLRPLRLGDSNRLSVGEWVLAAGNPRGYEVTAAVGIVSSLGETERASMVGSRRIPAKALLQTSAASDRLATGGPVVDMAGNVVGINVPSRDRNRGVAIPITVAAQVLPILEREGTVARGWLGLKILPVGPEEAKKANLKKPSGALISEIIPGGPAAKAALAEGDIILRFGDQTINERNLPWIVASAGLSPREVTIWRRGGEQVVTLIPEKMPK